MKKTLTILVLLALLTVNGALATPFGLLFSDVREPVAASSLGSYSKTAAGTNFSVLGLFGIGDSSIEKIAKSAGITKIKSVDKHTFSIFIFYVAETFTVYGE